MDRILINYELAGSRYLTEKGITMEKREFIRNPLTLIAIFAGLSEVAMTAVLPMLSTQNQAVFMWFVMIYPSMLVLMFFYVLIWKREALYAPSDFKDDATWLAVMRDKERTILEKYQVEPALNTPVASPIQKLIQDNSKYKTNPFYKFLESTGMAHDDILSIIRDVDNADAIPDYIKNKNRIKDAYNKVQRVLTDFPSSKNDFIKLRLEVGGK
jgi:hypothetical protein